MSKALRWKIPFQSVKGINYEIRIYDEGYTGSVVTLQAGETPITTQEDNSDDFFTPVRPSTGTISVIDPDGTLMEQLTPANNIARPVRLYSITNNVYTIEWQGFLSCESYNQDYTAVAQELQVNINSVLEAMDSQELQVADAGIKSVRLAIAECLQAMSDCTFTNIYIPIHDANILAQRINTAILFEENEISQENSVIYEISSIGCKAALERICTYMGWVVREQGTNIYFDRIGNKSNYYCYTYASFISSTTPSPTPQAKASINMSALTYRGTGHNKSTSQGAKSVSVQANVKTYELNFGMPACPYGHLTQTSYNPYSYKNQGTRYLYMLYTSDSVSTLTTHYYSRQVQFNIGTGAMSNAVMSITYDHEGSYTPSLTAMMDACLAELGNSAPCHLMQEDSLAEVLYAGATLCKYAFEQYIGGRIIHDAKDGLYCNFTPMYSSLVPDQTEYTPSKIFTIAKPQPVLLIGGWVRLDTKADFFLNALSTVPTGLANVQLRLQIKIGDKYWNGSAWVTTESTFLLYFIDGHPVYNNPTDMEEGYYMALGTGNLNGAVQLSVYDMTYMDDRMGAYTRSFPVEAIFSEITLDYFIPQDSTRSDRGENNYYQLLHSNFNDEVSITTEIATDLNNLPSASLVVDADNLTTYMRQLTYVDAEGNQYGQVPERDLLERLAAYYSKIRRTITLEAEHPASILPITTITGYDNRKYLPLAEERDWQQDTSTITCMETPDGDS